jgi:hypothetical protein
MYVDLPHEYKGTHMSRFVEMLHLLQPEVSLQKFSEILEDMKKHLNAASAHIEVTFPYFIEKKAPVSASPGLMDYTCRIVGTSDPSGKIDLVSEVIVPISSVCPCSLEISDHGAHNQRGEVQLATRFKKFIWMEDMIDLVEAAASTENLWKILCAILPKNWKMMIILPGFRSAPRISNPSTITVLMRISPAIKNSQINSLFPLESCTPCIKTFYKAFLFYLELPEELNWKIKL